MNTESSRKTKIHHPKELLENSEILKCKKKFWLKNKVEKIIISSTTQTQIKIIFLINMILWLINLINFKSLFKN